jgi:hypothetical protein
MFELQNADQRIELDEAVHIFSGASQVRNNDGRIRMHPLEVN